MNRRVVPRRRAALIAVAALVAAVSASCSGSPLGRPAAARVDGREISATRVFGLLKALRHNLEIEARDAKAAHQTVPAGGLPSSLLGDSADSWNTASFDRTLQPLIELEVLRGALSQRGVEVTGAETTEARAALETQLGGPAKLKTRDPDLVAFSIDLTAHELALRDALLKQGGGTAAREQLLRQLYDQRKAQLAQACLSVIVTATQAAATGARQQVAAGAPFAAVAKAKSTDASGATGGDVGCFPVANLTSQLGLTLDALRSGALIGPIQVQGSWDVIRVRSLAVPTYAQARPTLDKSVAPAGSTETTAELTRLLAKARVSIDPRYGRWDAKRATVVPPAAGTGTAPSSTSTPGP